MRDKIERPTTDEKGYERHPAWGMIGASRVQCSPGAVLFDSDIRHMHTVRIVVGTASRRRDLHSDYQHREKEFLELELSEAQWASFVSSMNTGNGVPCTIRRREEERQVPEMPHDSRLKVSIDEVRDEARDALAKVRAAFEEVEKKPTKANIKTLKHTIENVPANMAFAGTRLTEHTENVVQKARADIEAMVMSKAQQIGLKPGDVTIPELGTGDDS
jgi:hypothetical protein